VLPESLAGATPLWLAVRFLEPAIVELLLARGASPAATLRDGTTLLMAAAGVGVQPKLFDRRDRAVLLRDSDEAPALAMVNVLLARGADVQAANNRGETALHGAAAMNYPTVVRRLIERGARRDARNRKGETPAAVATGDEVREILGGR
jgi:ankyrin repeat protein